MKQKLLKTMLLLCALVVGMGNVWAADVVVYTLTPVSTGGSTSPHNSYTEAATITISEIGWSVTGNSNMVPWRIGGKSISNTDRTICSTTPISDNITKIVVDHGAASSITVNSMTVVVSKNSDFSSPVSTLTPSFAANTTVTINRPDGKDWSNCYYKITYNVTVSGSSNKFVEFNSATFYIEQIDITSISLPEFASVGKGGTTTLSPTILPANYNETVDWESDDPSVATVSSAGVVTGVAAGTAYITAKAHGNPSTIYDICEVTVTEPVNVTSVSLDKTSLTLSVGGTATLAPTIAPADATIKTVTWESDKTGVATVADGVITAVGEGTCTITVTTDDGGLTATCDVTVTTDVDLTSPISITTPWPSLSYGSAATYVAGGVCFTATQCMNNSGLQFKKSDGILASPLIKSPYGYTVIVTTNNSGTGTLTLQIGSETPVSVPSGGSSTYSATTSSTSVAFTLTNSSGNACNIASIDIVPFVPVTVSSAGYATFASPYALDFTDASIAAYIAEANGRTGVTFTQVNKVPANTGILLYKAGGDTENIPIFDGTGADAVTGNVFKVGTGAAVASTEGNKHNYILNKPTDKPLGFYKAADQTVATNKAYIQIDYDVVAAVKGFIALPGSEETAVEAVKAETEDGVIFNLAGQRVSKLQRGINIINGKKVVVK